MINKTEYAVYRFLDKNGYCHMVSDCVRGASLAQLAAGKAVLKKQQFWNWASALFLQAEQFYKWEEGESYGWFMPYAVIVAENGELLLLDVQEEGNGEIRSIMEKKAVRSLFVRKERVLTQHMTAEDDAYGLGKTLQFMAAKFPVSPDFTRKEIRVLERMIEKCTGGQELTAGLLKELRKEVRRCQERPAPGKRRKAALAAVAAAVSLTAAVTVFAASGTEEKAPEKKPPASVEQGLGAVKTTEPEAGSSGENREMELALLYLYALEKEEPGLDYLEEAAGLEGAEGELADCYGSIYRYLQRTQISFDEEELTEFLEKGEETLEEVPVKEELAYLYRLPFLRGWALLDTETAGEHMEALGEELTAEDRWGLTEDQEKELREYLAKARELLGNREGAAREYEALKEGEENPEELEQIYLKLMELYAQEDRESLWETCREAVKELPESGTLWLSYIRLQCEDEAVERERCVETVKEALAAVPDLKEEPDFQKLCQTSGITVEGETVWAEEKN